MSIRSVLMCKPILIFATLLLNACISASSSVGDEGGLCEGLVIDKKRYPMHPLPKPALGQSAMDPTFGTRILRISNAPKGSVIKPLYSPTQAWNAD